MPSLREQQRRLASVLLDQTLPEFAPGAGVYRHAYRARLEGALRVNYPALAQVLGAQAFREIANGYAASHPSHHASIRWHGEQLHSSMPTAPLKDLARMEWALGLAFDAADAPAADVAAMSRVQPARWSSLPLALHPATQVLAMDWAIERLWESARGNTEDSLPEPQRHRHALLVWRMDLQAHWRVASEEEGRALQALATCGTLVGACAGVEPARAETIGGWFALWIRDGLLAQAQDLRQ